jgi:hypothetical protein
MAGLLKELLVACDVSKKLIGQFQFMRLWLITRAVKPRGSARGYKAVRTLVRRLLLFDVLLDDFQRSASTRSPSPLNSFNSASNYLHTSLKIISMKSRISFVKSFFRYFATYTKCTCIKKTQ